MSCGLRLDRDRRRIGGDQRCSSRRHSAVCSPSSGARPGAGTPNSAAPSACVATGPTHTSSSDNNRSQYSSGSPRKNVRRAHARAPPGPPAYCRSASSGRPTSSQSRAKNFGSSAATVSRRPSSALVDRVAREPAREHRATPARACCEPCVIETTMRAPAAAALAAQQRSSTSVTAPRAPAARSADLHRRQRGRRRASDARPAEVVEVVPGALLVRSADAEAGDRAVDAVRVSTSSGPTPRRAATPGRKHSRTTSRSGEQRPRDSRRPPASGRRRPIPCRRCSASCQAGAVGASGRRPAPRRERPARRGAAARARRTRPGRYRVEIDDERRPSACIGGEPTTYPATALRRARHRLPKRSGV